MTTRWGSIYSAFTAAVVIIYILREQNLSLINYYTMYALFILVGCATIIRLLSFGQSEPAIIVSVVMIGFFMWYSHLLNTPETALTLNKKPQKYTFDEKFLNTSLPNDD